MLLVIALNSSRFRLLLTPATAAALLTSPSAARLDRLAARDAAYCPVWAVCDYFSLRHHLLESLFALAQR